MHLHRTVFTRNFVAQSLHKVLPSTTLYYKVAQSTSQYDFALQSLHKALLCTTKYYKACTKHFPVLLCTTKLAQSTSQYYFVLQSLHKVLPSTTLHYKACTKNFPVWLCTTKLAQSTSQYYFVLQSLHRARHSTTLYYKACTKYFPVLLCTNTTKLAQRTSHYDFVLQSLHRACPSTTLYYKACTEHVTVLLCTTKLAQSTSQYYFVLQSTSSVALSHRSFDTHSKLLHREAFTQRIVYTEKLSYCLIHNDSRNCSSKAGSRRQIKKTRLLKRNFERKITSAKIEKICWQITIAALMQPFQYDWRGPAAKQNSIRKQPRQYKSLQNIEEEPIRRWNERHRNRRTHEVPFIAGCSHLTRKKTRFRAPASSPKQTPCNIHAPITMRFAASRGKHASLYAHGNKTWHQSCSHSTAICNHRFQNTLKHAQTNNHPF